MFGDTPPVRSGNRHPLSTPFGAFRARDGYLVICVLNASQFTRLAVCMGQPELAADQRYQSDESRTRHEPALRTAIEAWLKDIGVADAVRILGDAGIPASAIEQAADVFSGDHVAQRGLLPEVVHPSIGRIPTMVQPVQFSRLTRGRQRPAPSPGRDDADVLGEWLALPPKSHRGDVR
jgi:CoA:oxalate CoA-transferase